MASLSNPSPTHRAFGVLHDLHSCESWQDLENFSLEVLHNLVGTDRTAWTDFRKNGVYTYNQWSIDHRSLKDVYSPIIGQFIGTDHPGITVLDPHQPWSRVYKITDFMSQRQFENTGLCREGYAPSESRFQTTLQVACSDFGLTTVTFGRNGSDFTDREQQALNLLIPHLRLVVNRIIRQQRIRDTFEPIPPNGETEHPTIAFDTQGTIRNANGAGVRLLNQFQGFDGEQLPLEIRRVLGTSVRSGSTIRTHMVIQKRFYRIAGRRPTHNSSRFVVFIEQTPGQLLGQKSKPARLTRREVEIALWAKEGKSNKEIGIILGISSRTVGKHLENVFLKLNIEGRNALMLAR
ncbi:MAG: hypothetical protein SynsKO_00930 [Synoicihabitans sp.]